ncbi:MAG: hypothetical protein IPG05_10700 [Gemmatimonadetes bacterium]|nr:hypothetical protein [Gemmatimonadota bacterium]
MPIAMAEISAFSIVRATRLRPNRTPPFGSVNAARWSVRKAIALHCTSYPHMPEVIAASVLARLTTIDPISTGDSGGK